MISDLVRPMGPKSVVHQRVEHLFRKLLTGDLTKLKNVVTVENAPTLMAMVYFVNVDLLQPKFDSNVARSIVKAAHGGTGTLCGDMFEEGQTEADLSGKNLGPGGAMLVAWDIRTGFVSASIKSLK